MFSCKPKEENYMKKRFVASVTMLVAVTLGATMLTGLSATGGLSASARQHEQTVAAHALFVKYMSSHAPMMRAGTGPTVLPASPGVTSSASVNWSGFADTPSTNSPSQSVTSASGSWTIPQVNCLSGLYRNQDAFLANWVGLDGYSDGTVEQLGTATQCYEGVEYYYDWIEMYPAGTIEEGTQACINNNVNCPRPGDRITASVVSTPGTGANAGNNEYTLKLTDFSNPAESFDVANQACPATTCLNSSAEWIVERPAFEVGPYPQFLPQAYYGQTGFTNGTVGVGNRVTSLDQYRGTVNDIQMVDDSIGYILSCPGQNSPPGQLLELPEATSISIQSGGSDAGSPCGPTNAFGGNFSVTWDGSF
jgi:hypothetical protein